MSDIINYSDYNEQHQESLNEIPFLSLDELSTEEPFEGIKDRVSFKEILFDSKHGDQIEKCGVFKDDFYNGSIDAKKLFDDLRTNKTRGSLFFYYKNYCQNLPQESTYTSFNSSGPPGIITLSKSVPYQYKGLNGKDKIAQLDIKLNKRACYINLKNLGFVWDFKPTHKTFSVGIQFVYEDAISKRDFNITPQVQNDYTIDNKYNGIVLETKNTQDLIAISKELGFETYVLNKLRILFKEYLTSTNDVTELRFLYEQLPEELINDREFIEAIGYKTLYTHFKAFFNYDTDGFWSGFKDASNSVIKSLRCLVFYNNEVLSTLINDPSFIKQAYKNLDGSSEYEGEMEENRTIFSNVLWSLCLINGFKGLNHTGITYKYGATGNLNYKLDSNVWVEGKDDKILLRQVTEETTTKSVTLRREEEDYSGTHTTSHTEEINPDGGNYFHPLDLVRFEVYINDQDTQVILVPAIFVKAISDKEEWQDINRKIRIGLDIVAVLLGMVTLGTTTGLWAVLAVADIAIAGTDAIVQTYHQEIAKTAEGQEMLKTWDKIYMVGGAVTAGPLLLQAFYKASTKFINYAIKVKNANYLNYARALVLKAFLEVNVSNFVKSTVKIVEPQEIFFSGQYRAMVQEMASNGVLFVSGKKEGKLIEYYAAIYKGEIVEGFSKGEIHNFYKKWGELKGDKLLGALENIYKKTIFEFEDFIKSVPEFANDVALANKSYNLFKQQKWKELEEFFKTRNINEGWPPFDGFIKKGMNTLKRGDQIDRYGGRFNPITGLFEDSGKYFAKKGTKFSERALPANYEREKVLSSYKILKDLPVIEGDVIPWFNQKGLGLQYMTRYDVDKLLEKGYIKLINRIIQ